MKRVLLIYTNILDYRLPVFQELGSIYDLTVTHSGIRKTNDDMGFQEIVLPVKKIGRFRYQKGLIKLIRNGNFSAIIFFADIAWLSSMVGFFFSPKGVKRITWGLWATKNAAANRIRMLIAHVADSNVFYNDCTAKEFRRKGIPIERMEVARNTVFVDRPLRDENSERDSILVIGSFNVRKRNDVTVSAFNEVSKLFGRPIRLVFIGEGSDRNRIIELAQSLEFSDRVEFCPYETNSRVLRMYYSKAICSVSFGQAGLSVLQSFGYGVPFITMRNAISGGEIENISHGVNGFLCKPAQASLEHYLLKLCRDPEYADELGRNALKFYRDQATVQVMVAGFQRAIDRLHY